MSRIGRSLLVTGILIISTAVGEVALGAVDCICTPRQLPTDPFPPRGYKVCALGPHECPGKCGFDDFTGAQRSDCKPTDRGGGTVVKYYDFPERREGRSTYLARRFGVANAIGFTRTPPPRHNPSCGFGANCRNFCVEAPAGKTIHSFQLALIPDAICGLYPNNEVRAHWCGDRDGDCPYPPYAGWEGVKREGRTVCGQAKNWSGSWNWCPAIMLYLQ